MSGINIWNGIYLIYTLIVIGTIFVVVTENRNPIRTLAWILVLIFLPAIGIICYYIFGQVDWKAKQLFHIYNQRNKEISLQISFAKNQKKLRAKYGQLSNLLEETCSAPVIEGSDIEVITKGTRKIDQLLADIKGAKEHIHMEYYIFRNDISGKKIKKALIQKAKQGIEVRFLYDNVGSWFVPPQFYHEMKTDGVKVSPFMKVKASPLIRGRFSALRKKINYHNHRKIVVIDGKIGYVGGMNIGDEYFYDANWRDTHLRITGPGVYSLQAAFLLDWFSSGERDISNYKELFPPLEKKSNNLLQIAPGGPNLEQQNLLLATTWIFTNAKRYLYIQSPYFLPTQGLVEGMKIAALGGVDVRIMTSNRSDHFYLDPAAHSYFSDLLQAGVKIYLHTNKFVHAKTLVCDDYLSVIGSTNMDFRSFEYLFEINSYLYDEEIAKQNKQIFLSDAKECKKIILEEWKKRGKLTKFMESLLRLFAPLM